MIVRVIVHRFRKGPHLFVARALPSRTENVIRQPAVLHDQDPVGEDQRFLDVVGHEDDRVSGAAPQVQQQPVQAQARDVVERAEGFVHQEDVGPGREHGGEGDALAHASGELARPGVGEFVETDLLEPAGGEPLALIRRSCPWP